MSSHEADLQSKLRAAREELVWWRRTFSPETGEHRYLSTACRHGRHDLCRLTCKYCEDVNLCVCPVCQHSLPPEKSDI